MALMPAAAPWSPALPSCERQPIPAPRSSNSPPSGSGCAAAELALDNWTVRRGNYAHPLEPMIAEHYGGAGFEFIGRGMVKVPNDPKAPLGAAALFWMPCWVGAEVEVDRETGKVQVVH